MKKLIGTALAAALLMTAAPTAAIAEKEPVTSWSETIAVGDMNGDGELNIADLVLLRKYVLNGETSGISSEHVSNADVNLDGTVNSFDMIALRKFLLDPGAVKTISYSIDVLQSTDSVTGASLVLRSTAELAEYLDGLGTDETETQKYLERYDDEFFAKNVLLLYSFTQERGNDVAYRIADRTIKASCAEIMLAILELEDRYDEKIDFGGMEQYGAFVHGLFVEYEDDELLLPVTNLSLLAQVTVPRLIVGETQLSGWFDGYRIFGDDTSTYTYSSPDGEFELYVTQRAFLLNSTNKVYRKNDDGTYTFLTYCDADDGGRPFDGDGYWSKNEDGYDVFSNDISFSLTWKEDCVVVDTQFEYDLWQQQTIYFDGTVGEKLWYTK